MRTIALVAALSMSACSLGERGGKQEERPVKPVAAALTAPAAPKAPAAPGTCEATVDKLVALSMIEAEAIGKPWSAESRAKRHKTYLDRCTKELAEGVVTPAAMTCVEGSTTLDAARECLIAIAK